MRDESNVDKLRNRRYPNTKANCSHPSMTPEIMYGAKTGDYYCDSCGDQLSPADYQKWKKGQYRG